VGWWLGQFGGGRQSQNWLLILLMLQAGICPAHSRIEGQTFKRTVILLGDHGLMVTHSHTNIPTVYYTLV
jgi:hypothetical protein